MARTAPVPNIPPIPGMCPSLAVMAGGGDGGGGSGKGGKQGDASASGNGSGNGDGAGDDGKNAGDGTGCGPGAPGGSCPQHQAGASKGDPVDVATGNVFTLPATDVWFRGPLHLVFCRRYRSELRRQEEGLGAGWTHNLAWRIEQTRSGLRVVSGTGTSTIFPELLQGEQAVGRLGWQLRREAGGFSLLTKDELLRRFEHAHDDVWRMTSVTFRTAHSIALSWDAGRLLEAVDPAGRRLRFSYDPHGRVNALSGLGTGNAPLWKPLAAYAYSEAGDLILATDSDGRETSYGYDEYHRLVRVTDGAGSSTHYRYDEQDRCLETWVSRSTSPLESPPDPALAEDEKPLLADGISEAKGFLHCVFTYGPDGYVEVTDSRATQRYFGRSDGSIDKSVTDGAVVTRAFDDLGYEIARSDPLAGTSNFERDRRGNLIAFTDPLGRRREVSRDADGRAIAERDQAGHVRRFERDVHGNMTRFVDVDEHITSYRWEAGLPREVAYPSGQRQRFAYDETGDVIELTAGSARYGFRYDEQGRLTAFIHPNGREERYGYSASGDLIYLQDVTGAEWHYTFDGAHQVVGIQYPDGGRATIERGAFHLPYRITKPDQSVINFRYDREGRPRHVENALGQRHSYERSPEGFITKEHTFDGRTISYRYDAGRRVVTQRNGKEVTKLKYDAVGNLLECEYPDGATAAYEYDERDLLVKASNDAAVVTFERDAAGRIVKETQQVAGDPVVVETSYDAWGLRASRSTSRGHRLEFAREGEGGARKVVLDGSLEVAVTHNLAGLVSSFSFPAGGTIAFHYDDKKRLVAEEQHGPRAPQGRPSSLPDFPGVPPSPNLVRAFRYSRRGSLVNDWDRDGGLRYHEHDALGQVLSRTDDKGKTEAYHYDAAGNVLGLAGTELRYEGGAARPTHLGDTALRWDELGRLIEKATPDAPPWRFEWNGRSELARAKRGKRRVEFAYDATGRRVSRKSYDDRDRVIESTRFVWDQGTVVHEVTVKEEGGKRVTQDRAFWSDPEVNYPVAERDAGGDWRFALRDPSGAPHRYVDTAGGTVGKLELGVFGQLKSARPAISSARFAGQTEDAETGLAYNLCRYYDPSQGRYISPDPLGIIPGLNPFRYVENMPTTWADPSGLAGNCFGFLVLNDGSRIPPEGTLGSGKEGKAPGGNKIGPNTEKVKEALPEASTDPDGPLHKPGDCAEAHLMSELEKAGKKPEDIAPGGMVIIDKKTGQIKPACIYCGPMLANLGVKPEQILQPGQPIPAIPKK